MISVIRSRWGAFLAMVRTPTLSRSVIVLFVLALALMLVVNAATFVMIQRTARYNETVERTQALRLTGQRVMTLMVDAETGQRGFLLTARPDYLVINQQARDQLPPNLARLEELGRDNPDLAPRLEHLNELIDERLVVMDTTIQLAREGRIAEAVQLMRSGVGKALMDAIRDDIAAIDEVEATRLAFRTRRSEASAGATLLINALAGVLVLALAGLAGWLVRRYIMDLTAARARLDAMNAGLEDEVRSRTGDLMRANEEIQRFAYIVSHDLRAPLVNVMGYTAELEQAGQVMETQIARLEAEAPAMLDPDAQTAVREDVPEAIGFIRASTSKMDRLINAILRLSRDGRRRMVAEPLDLTALARGIADSVMHQTLDVGAEIVVEPLPMLESDRLSMEQVLGNLVDNAVKYLDPSRPGRIVIDGEELADGRVLVRVADNGRGVAPKDHERIFELFRRSGRQDRPGEGLGLAFVRNSIRRMGGTIEIESELHKGSTFLLKFPKRLIVTEAGEGL